MLWSNEKTCQSQIAQIKKCGIEIVEADEILEDVDEMEDWLRLCTNFGIKWNKDTTNGTIKDIDDEKESDDKAKYDDYRQNFPRVSALLLET